MSNNPTCLGLDIGGANLKAYDSTGRAESVSFALYREPDRLADELRALAARMAAPQVVVATMTAELCDCFVTRRQGVMHVLAALEAIYQPGVLRIWGVDGAFHTPTQIKSQPLLAAASNWKALGDCLASEFFSDKTGLVIDIGTTTTDILAVSNGKLLSDSRTDLDRLQSGELVYLGVARTPLCAVVDKVRYRKTKTPVMRELFATTADIYWTKGDLAEEPDDQATANGRSGTRAEARHRLARMIGLDYEDFTEADAAQIAAQVDEEILKRLGKAVRSVAKRISHMNIDQVIVSGSGSFLAQRLAEELVDRQTVINLQSVWGESLSSAACAVALVKLANGLLKS